MKPGSHIVVRAAARLHMPLIALFALSLVVTRPPGAGIGLIAGLALTLALMLHVLVFGAGAGRRAIPGPVARAMLAIGVLAALASAGLPNLPYSAQVTEAGLFLTTYGGAALAIAVLAGRAPTLRDEEA